MSRTVFKSSLSFKTTALLALGLISLVSAPQIAHAQTAQAAQKPVLTTLHRFDGTQGAFAQTTLTLGKDGNFYGVTLRGGLGNRGTVFTMTPAGQFTTLFRFNGSNGRGPFGALAEGVDGAFYGTTSGGGAKGGGTAFRITTEGQFTLLHSFSATDGSAPHGALLPAPDGSFYGTTGSIYSGAVFHMTADGTVTTLHTFNGPDGADPGGVLAFGSNGAIYGTTLTSGPQGSGVVFRVTTGGNLQHPAFFYRKRWSKPRWRADGGTRRRFLRHDISRWHQRRRRSV